MIRAPAPTAAAPSEIDEELAAVTVPSFLNAGLSVGILATSSVKGVSSLSTTTSPLRVFVGHRRNLGFEIALVDGGERAAHRFGGELVLGLRA